MFSGNDTFSLPILSVGVSMPKRSTDAWELKGSNVSNWIRTEPSAEARSSKTTKAQQKDRDKRVSKTRLVMLRMSSPKIAAEIARNWPV
jgi:hypothetical protein